MKSKGIWSKRSKKHVILISQTAHTNPWIYRDPKLIMILATWLAGGLMKQRATHSLSEQAGVTQLVGWPQKWPTCFSFHHHCLLFFFLNSWHERTLSGIWLLSFAHISAFFKKKKRKKRGKKLSRQICLNIWLMMFISPTGHRGLISSLATWWPISSYSGWEEADGWGYNHPLLRHILLSYSGS